MKIKLERNVKAEASYGGAYDIADDQYFSREDLNNLSEEIEYELVRNRNIPADVIESYIDGGFAEVTIRFEDGEFTHKEKIDMRTIKKPNDLHLKYARKFADAFETQIKEIPLVENFYSQHKDILERTKITSLQPGDLVLVQNGMYDTGIGKIIRTYEDYPSSELSRHGVSRLYCYDAEIVKALDDSTCVGTHWSGVEYSNSIMKLKDESPLTESEVEDDYDEESNTYWYGKYKDAHGVEKKIIVQIPTQEYETAEEEFEMFIPEPYTTFKLLGDFQRKDSYMGKQLSKEGYEYLTEDISSEESIDFRSIWGDVSQHLTSKYGNQFDIVTKCNDTGLCVVMLYFKDTINCAASVTFDGDAFEGMSADEIKAQCLDTAEQKISRALTSNFGGFTEAQETIAKYSKEQVRFVQTAFNDYIRAVNGGFEEGKPGNGAQIKKEWAEESVIDGILTEDEFNELWNAVKVVEEAKVNESDRRDVTDDIKPEELEWSSTSLNRRYATVYRGQYEIGIMEYTSPVDGVQYTVDFEDTETGETYVCPTRFKTLGLALVYAISHIND